MLLLKLFQWLLTAIKIKSKLLTLMRPCLPVPSHQFTPATVTPHWPSMCDACSHLRTFAYIVPSWDAPPLWGSDMSPSICGDVQAPFYSCPSDGGNTGI